MAEVIEGGVVAVGQAALFDQLPQAFDEVEIGAAPDEAMTGSFMVHPQVQPLVVETLFDGTAFRGFADLLKLLGGEL